MAVTEIKFPAYVKIENTSDKALRITPYKENFNTTIPGGEALVLNCETAGQVFYYKKQESEDLVVTVSAEKPAISESDYDVCAPATVTIENKAARPLGFIPYRETFSFELAAGEGYTFEAKTPGQALYYWNQDSNGQDIDGGLDVTVVAKA